MWRVHKKAVALKCKSRNGHPLAARGSTGERMAAPAVGQVSSFTLVLAHLALMSANALLGIGSVVSKIGLAGCNPVIFALLRELMAAPLLFVMSVVLERTSRSDDESEELVERPRCTPISFTWLDVLQFSLAGLMVCARALEPSNPLRLLSACVAARVPHSSLVRTSGISSGLNSSARRPPPSGRARCPSSRPSLP